MIGWTAEAFARTKTMKPLPEYLKAAQPARGDKGAMEVKAMFDRMIAKQEAKDGV